LSLRTVLSCSLVVLVWLFVGVCGISSSSTTSTENCLQLFDTYSQGVYVCQHHSDLIVALQIAEELGREECQRAFERDIWNCSGFSILKAPNVTSLATKEAAYVHALSLAAIAHSVAKVCAVGDVTSCSCDTERLELPATDSESRYAMGCSDNVGFGLNFATNFLHKRHLGVGPLQEIERENMRIGARVVQDEDEPPYVCHCIGVSGSCTVLTCQYELPEFSQLAHRIQDYYFTNRTCKVRWNNIIGEGSAFVRPPGCGDNKLVYMVDSPNYCIRDVVVGSLGTAGRECDPHATGPNSCENLCTRCGRGHVSIEESTESNCWCEFVFCCEIRCSKCPERRRYHVCT
jgi:hypothetical protein